jgi:hypothetical protein
MTFFTDTISLEELKTTYRQLVMAYHPDRGGDNETMKRINYEDAHSLRRIESKPKSLRDLKVGHTVIVNNSKNVVTEISMDYFKAKSLDTKREAYFSKNTGYALLNFNFRERV